MIDFNDYRPWPSAQRLLQWLQEAHLLTLALFDDLSPEMLAITPSPKVNLPLWEFGHVGWFNELWVHRRGDQHNTSLLLDSDRYYDSSNVAHGTRWELALPDRAQTRNYLVSVFEKTRALLKEGLDAQTAYFIQLAIYHQDMHNEAFSYTRQTLGYPLPLMLQESFEQKKKQANALNKSLATNKDLYFPSSSLDLGASKGQGFFFDNEKWSQQVQIEAFSISPRMVTNQEIVDFLVATSDALVPEYWKCIDGVWHERKFDQWRELELEAIAVHVSYDLASAYCAWSDRRLPTEAEWFCLRTSPASDAGLVAHSFLWEWTASVFGPFKGFSPDPYRDYSAPWMDGRHQVLRGASWMTPERLKRPGFRNFYQKNRADIFCGFRTCGL